MHLIVFDIAAYCCLCVCDWKLDTPWTEASKGRPWADWNPQHELRSWHWMETCWFCCFRLHCEKCPIEAVALSCGVKSDTQTRPQGSWWRKHGRENVHESSSCFTRWVTISHKGGIMPFLPPHPPPPPQPRSISPCWRNWPQTGHRGIEVRNTKDAAGYG